jgi:hypothetical protein
MGPSRSAASSLLIAARGGGGASGAGLEEEEDDELVIPEGSMVFCRRFGAADRGPDPPSEAMIVEFDLTPYSRIAHPVQTPREDQTLLTIIFRANLRSMGNFAPLGPMDQAQLRR